MKSLLLAFILPCLLSSLPALAEDSPLKPQTQGEVSFVSGGVGSDEQAALQAVRADYNMRLLFSVSGTGEYLSGVDVQIADTNGNILLKTVSEGSKLFAKLKPGRYTITVEHDGKTLHQTARVGGKRGASLSFVWPQ